MMTMMNVTFLIGDHGAYVTVPVDTKGKLESVCSVAVFPLFRMIYRPVCRIVICRRVLNFLKIKLVVFVKMEARQYLFLLRVSVHLGTKAHVVKVRRI